MPMTPLSSLKRMLFILRVQMVSGYKPSVIPRSDSCMVCDRISVVSCAQLFVLIGISLFRDRYLLTLDSKVMSDGSPEACRLLFFDPRNGLLILEKPIVINRQSKMFLEQQDMINYIQGDILPESTSKLRFLAVHNDHIYMADLGKQCRTDPRSRAPCIF